MPPQEKPKKSLLRKVFGGPTIPENWPELYSSYSRMEREYPEDTARTTRVAEMGPFSKWRYPDAHAVTGPLGTIHLNRELIEKENQDLDQVLSHELKHVGQGMSGFLRKFYEPNEVENEAINREAMRPMKRKDINLPLSGMRK